MRKNYKKDFHTDFRIHMNFVMEMLINLFYYQEKEFIHTNTCIVGNDLMKNQYQKKKNFTVV